jgi:hypothetical protein
MGLVRFVRLAGLTRFVRLMGRARTDFPRPSFHIDMHEAPVSKQ